MSELAGRVVLVTGGTSGLGEATARLLASRGAKVAIAGRRKEKGEAIIADIAASGGEAWFVEADVSKSADIANMVAATVGHFGRLDGAVNNAGIVRDGFVATADITEENWNEVVSVNLTGVWLSIKHEIPAMLASGGGSIVNMASMYGLIGSDLGNASYNATKFAVVGLTKAAAIDYAQQGIRVNAVCPGFCHSEMVDPILEGAADVMQQVVARHSAMNRVGEASEVAEAIAWLLSGRASFVNGVALPIEGGETSRLF